MAVYLRDIQIKAYTTPDGKPTCRTADAVCCFYRTLKFGQLEQCSYDESEIKRSDNAAGIPNLGYTVVTTGCPVWNSKTIKE
jgi:hypothetical protein